MGVVACRHSKHKGTNIPGCCCKACTRESPKFLARRIVNRPSGASMGPGSEIEIKLVLRQKISPYTKTQRIQRSKQNKHWLDTNIALYSLTYDVLWFADMNSYGAPCSL